MVGSLSRRLVLFLRHRNLTSKPLQSLLTSRHLSSSAPSPSPFLDPTPPRSRGPTQAERNFDSWVSRLSPGFTSDDLAMAIRAESDPDLALDLFRWASLRPGYRHSASSYHAALSAAISSSRFASAESLVDEVLAGACSTDLPLFNICIRFCCSRRNLFSHLFFKAHTSPPFPSFALSTFLLRSSHPSVLRSLDNSGTLLDLWSG